MTINDIRNKQDNLMKDLLNAYKGVMKDFIGKACKIDTSNKDWMTEFDKIAEMCFTPDMIYAANLLGRDIIRDVNDIRNAIRLKSEYDY